MKKLILIILLFAGFASAASPVYAQSTRKERRYISAGNKLYKEGKYKEASRQYQMAVAENPQSPEGRFNLALCQLRLSAQPGLDEKQSGQLLQAGEEGMKQIISLGPSNPSLASYAAYNLGNVAFNAQKYPEAIQCYKESLRFNPADDNARRNLRIAQKKLQDQNKDKQDQNKDQNKDKQDKNKDKNKDQNKDQNKDKQDKNQNQKQQPQNPPKQDNSMSNNTAEQILKAMENKENGTRARMNASGQGKGKGQNGSRKNW